MSSSNLLTKREVAELTGRSDRWVEMNAGRFGARPIGTAANGRAVMGFDLAALPPEAQLAWAERQRSKVVEIAPAIATAATPAQLALALAAPAGPNLSDADRAEAERRFKVIEPIVRPEAYDSVWLYCGRRRRKVIEWVAGQHQVALRTVYLWISQFTEHGLPGLVGRERSDKGKPRRMNAAALDFLVALSLPRKGSYGELSGRERQRAYDEERVWRESHVGQPLGEFERRKYARYIDSEGRLLATALLPKVSYECMRQWVCRIPDIVTVRARGGVEAFANSQEIISYRAIGEVQPLDYVVMDHRRLDLFCMVRERGGWRLVRPWLTAAIDMRTRKWLAWVMVQNPSSDSIAAVLKKCFVQHGVPRAVYWDNGKDFTCEWLEGKQERTHKADAVRELEPTMRGVMETLGVRVHHAIVRRARSKIIEPNFLNTSLHDKSLPWWCGHKPGARPERFQALLDAHEAWLEERRKEPAFPTIEEVAADYNAFLGELNEREHTGVGMEKVTPNGRGWKSPNECWDELIGRVERRTVPAEVLQFCFAKRKELVVRHGEVQTTFDQRIYHYRMLDNGAALMMLNGRKVELAYDPLELGTAAVYYNGGFLGLVECVDLRHMGTDDFVEDEKLRRRARRDVNRIVEAAHQVVHVPDYRERVARRQAVEPAAAPARVEIPVALPAPVTQAVEAARQDREFSFAAAKSADIARAAGRDDDSDDGEFRFFK